MLISKEVKIKLWGSNIKYYNELGYVGKQGNIITVKVEDLPICSTVLVETKCDYCGKTRKPIKYVDYNAQTKNGTKKCCCVDCAKNKRSETMIELYGNSNPMAIQEFAKKRDETNLQKYGSKSPTNNLEVREKQKQTLMRNYGVENPSQSKQIQDKRKQTFLNTFGVENPYLVQEIRDKANKTNLEKYGVENVFLNKDIQNKKNITLIEKYGTSFPLQNKDCFEKMKQTNMTKYGVEFIPQLEETKQKVKETNLKRCGYENYMQSPEFMEKWIERNSSGFVRTSNQQRYLCNLYNGILNYPFKCFALDIYLPEYELDIEFDGSGHKMSITLGDVTEEEFKKKELYRNIALYKSGYKQIHIISSKDLLPSDTILLQMLEHAKEYFSTTNHTWIEYNIDTSSVRNTEHKDGIFFNYGELRKIKRIA